jgi:phosphatidylinositol alpha-mannosyltransferase
MAEAVRIAILADPVTVALRGGRHAAELAVALAKLGCEVRLFGAARALERAKRTDGGPSATTLGQEVLSFRPQFVLAYGARSPVAWVASRWARRARAPLVLIEQGELDEASGWQRALLRVGTLLWGPLVRRRARAVVALDQGVRTQLLGAGFAPERVGVLSHGVELERFRSASGSSLLARHAVRGRILLAPSTRHSARGLELLLRCFARSLGQRPDWSLVVASAHEGSVELRACAERLGVGASVHLLRAGDEDWPGLFVSSTLVAVTGEEAAATRLSLARACAAGRAVLATDIPSHRELIERAGIGLVVPLGDEARWTEALRDAARAPERREAWGANARRHALDLDWAQLAQRYLELLRRAAQAEPLARTGSPRPPDLDAAGASVAVKDARPA